MKVLLVNGSSRLTGCTYTALSEVGKSLEENGVEYEIFQLGPDPIRDCIACGKCVDGKCVFDDDKVNIFIDKAAEAEGFVFGSPVYYAHPSGRILSFLDRVFYAASKKGIFVGKPGTAVVSARRGGTTASLDVLNKYFTISSMPLVSSTYWNMVHGSFPEDVQKDLEGLQTMRNIGKNMAWLLKNLPADKNLSLETDNRTNFIR